MDDQPRTMMHDVTLTVAAAVAAIGIVVTLVAGRVRANRLHELSRSASEVADHQLPKLVEMLSAWGHEDVAYLTASVRPLPSRGTGDVARLATAFNTLQEAVVDLANDQAALMRKGIGPLFVNLARRNQALVEAQIARLDQLEATERDPARLGRLVELDHFATRLRRNTESLLVAAGEEVTRTRGRPVALYDIVRTAVGEAEGYRAVRLGTLEPVDIVGAAAADLAHLLAELIDNATCASPPGTPVEVGARRTSRGFTVSVADRGNGMTEAEIAAANETLTRPPVSGAPTSAAIGLVVVARLAARHGVNVRLVGGPDAGVVALVSLPWSLIASELEEAPEPVADDEQSWDDAPLPYAPVTYSELVGDNDLDGILTDAFADAPVSSEGDVADEELDPAV